MLGSDIINMLNHNSNVDNIIIGYNFDNTNLIEGILKT